MWKLTVDPHTVLATPDLVVEFATMQKWQADRDLRPKRVAAYQGYMLAGTFRPPEWIAVWCEELQCWIRMNGNHTSRALFELPTIPRGFKVVVSRYHGDTVLDCAALYNTIDPPEASRNAKDIWGSIASTMAEFDGFPRSYISNVVYALAYAEWGDGLTAHHARARGELLLENGPFIRWLTPYTFGDSKVYGHFKRVAVTAAMYATFTVDVSAATEFWRLTRDESHPRPTDQTRQLAKWLYRVSAKANPQTRQEVVKDREMYARCVSAWNNWRRGSEAELRYYPLQPVPAPI